MTGSGNLKIRPFNEEIVPDILDLNSAYLERYPDAELLTGDMLLSPAYENGENSICAFDTAGRLAGYVPLQPSLALSAEAPDIVWANMVIGVDNIQNNDLRDLLFEQTWKRAGVIVASSPGSSAFIMFQHHVSEVEAIDFLVSAGTDYVDSVLRMVKDLTGDIAFIDAPDGIQIKRGDIRTDTEIAAYVTARNEALGMPVTIDEWRHFLFSVTGDSGTTIAAFDQGTLAGAVSAYWIEEDNRRLGKDTGWTENVFVLEGWWGKGIADALLSAACMYLKERGMVEAWLDPGASNKRAVRVYQRCGYRITGESRQYRIRIK